jgi:two-component system, chemotaxis family, CheB/CheR fusion protein
LRRSTISLKIRQLIADWLFVVILHLPIARKSMLSDILGRWTNMAVIDAIDGTRIENNCVYVPPPHSLVKLKGGCLHIQMPEPDAPREHCPIDVFFDPLAAAEREDAIGIVLSGTGKRDRI